MDKNVNVWNCIGISSYLLVTLEANNNVSLGHMTFLETVNCIQVVNKTRKNMKSFHIITTAKYQRKRTENRKKEKT